MYHMIVLERLLDALNFAKANDDELVEPLTTHARKMTCLAMNWSGLERIPMMQDSACGIAFQLEEVLAFAERLLAEDMPRIPGTFGQSGYRTLTSGALTALSPMWEIGPTYQPAHAHADELSILNFTTTDSQLVTYVGVRPTRKMTQRLLERSTQSHNCIGIGRQISATSGQVSVLDGGRKSSSCKTPNRVLWQGMMDNHRPMSSESYESVNGRFAIIDHVLP